MSALARHFISEKKVVSGSDRVLTDLTKELASEGIQIFGEQVAENITKKIELVVYTEAMPADHPELAAARKLKIPTLNYFETLGLAMNPYYLIAVAGTHGKTTTTAMLTDIFSDAEKDPTAVIGSLRAETKSNYRAGKSKYAIVEACEYRRDFLHLKPDVLVITNLEHEHVDYYKDLSDVQSAFRTLAEQVNEDGIIITDTANPNIAPILEGLPVSVIDYRDCLDLTSPMKHPGLHNRMNAAAATAVSVREKIPLNDIKISLSNFAGTWRRFEYKGEVNGAPVYDDYAHHPTEIRATLAGVRELYPENRVIVVFQPHTFTRTKTLFDNFAKAMQGADTVMFLPIYAAREENISGVSSRELAVKTLEYVPDTLYVDFSEAETKLRATLGTGDVLVIMGAGTISELATKLTE